MKKAFALILVLAFASSARAQSLAGLWDATVVVSAGRDAGTIEVPFRFEIAGSGSNIRGSFFNGDEKVTSTSGQLANGRLALSFDEYGTKLEADVKNGQLEGQYTRGTRGAPYPFKAKRFAPARSGDEKIPSIAGLWNVQVGKSSKGGAAWQPVGRQAGPEVSAGIRP